MIKDSVNGRDWIKKSLEKLKAYLKRAPLLVSYITKSDGVFITIDNTKQKFFFSYDYDIDPKKWVHNIKDNLVNSYPRLVEDIVETYIYSPEELALIAEKTGSIENIPAAQDIIIRQNCWRIDKVLIHDNIFILYLEGSIDMRGNKKFIPSDEPVMRRFKYTRPSVLFMKKQRSGVYKSVNELSKDFFDNVIPLDDLTIKNE